MVAKLYPKDDCTSFDALARVMSGTLKKGQNVRVLGEAYSPDDEEDCAVRNVSNLWVYQARYRIPVEEAAGRVLGSHRGHRREHRQDGDARG
jgi:U5 small nuclear ribonucleoprotein component